jgi:hypothetical protein
MSAHRLRSLCTSPTDRALVDAALDWTATVRRPKSRAVERATLGPAERRPLFPDHMRLVGDLDPAFARHGFVRPPATPSHKSQVPSLATPINFAFRLRRMLGVGVRAEVIRGFPAKSSLHPRALLSATSEKDSLTFMTQGSSAS